MMTLERTVRRHRGLSIPKPSEVEEVVKKIPRGKLMTSSALRALLARKYRAVAGLPPTSGLFIRIVARTAAAEMREGRKRIVPYWRIIKENGALIDAFPGGVIEQSMRLLSEGHTLELGKKRSPPRIKDFSQHLVAH